MAVTDGGADHIRRASRTISQHRHGEEIGPHQLTHASIVSVSSRTHKVAIKILRSLVYKPHLLSASRLQTARFSTDNVQTCFAMSPILLYVLLFIEILLQAPSVAAFWRLPCHMRTGIGRIDPVVSFGRPSDHAHILFGGQGMFYEQKASGPQITYSFLAC